jgi:hypothetical protein
VQERATAVKGERKLDSISENPGKGASKRLLKETGRKGNLSSVKEVLQGKESRIRQRNSQNYLQHPSNHLDEMMS